MTGGTIEDLWETRAAAGAFRQGPFRVAQRWINIGREKWS